MSKRILIVEDQEDLRAILRDFLSASGYTVIEAVDGTESVAKAASERPALPPRRGESDSTVTRTHRVEGEALSSRMRNHPSKVGRITG
jgi:CheY-like chemotaxis protein